MAWWNQTVSISRTADINVFQRVSIHPSTRARPQWGTILVNRPSRQTVVSRLCAKTHTHTHTQKERNIETSWTRETTRRQPEHLDSFHSCIRILRLPSAKTIIPLAFAVSSSSRLFFPSVTYFFFFFFFSLSVAIRGKLEIFGIGIFIVIMFMKWVPFPFDNRNFEILFFTARSRNNVCQRSFDILVNLAINEDGKYIYIYGGIETILLDVY